MGSSETRYPVGLLVVQYEYMPHGKLLMICLLELTLRASVILAMALSFSLVHSE